MSRVERWDFASVPHRARAMLSEDDELAEICTIFLGAGYPVCRELFMEVRSIESIEHLQPLSFVCSKYNFSIFMLNISNECSKETFLGHAEMASSIISSNEAPRYTKPLMIKRSVQFHTSFICFHIDVWTF